MSFELSTKFGGLELKSPLIVGSCPMSGQELQRVAMITNGVGAIVLPSLFEEQLIVRARIFGSPQHDLESYLAMLQAANERSTVPLIASINGHYETDWRATAGQLSDAGASAIELTIRQSDSLQQLDPRAIEDGIVRAAEQVKSSIDIPLFVKLTREFTSISHLAGRLKPHVSGLVLFGRAPVIDIELDSLKRTTKWGLTEPGSIVRSLEPIIRLRSHHPELPIAACGGIGTSIDLIKALLAGANVGMVTSTVCRDGTTVLGSLLQGLTKFMELHNLSSMAELSQTNLTTAPANQIEPSDTELTQDAIHPAFTCDRFGHAKRAD